MMKLEMNVRRHIVGEPSKFAGDDATCHGVYVVDGHVTADDNAYSVGDGFFARGGMSLNGNANVLQFSVATAPLNQATEPTLSAAFGYQNSEAIIRLDQVTFPPNARAYRHIHPGAGIRYLFCGALEIKSDHETDLKKAGDAWFEDANSPVQATAANVPETSFIRMLVLPVVYEGKPTIKLLNAEDEALPKLQTNKRFFDKLVKLA